MNTRNYYIALATSLLACFLIWILKPVQDPNMPYLLRKDFALKNKEYPCPGFETWLVEVKTSKRDKRLLFKKMESFDFDTTLMVQQILFFAERQNISMSNILLKKELGIPNAFFSFCVPEGTKEKDIVTVFSKAGF
jgi:hypothetical protein